MFDFRFIWNRNVYFFENLFLWVCFYEILGFKFIVFVFFEFIGRDKVVLGC